LDLNKKCNRIIKSNKYNHSKNMIHMCGVLHGRYIILLIYEQLLNNIT